MSGKTTSPLKTRSAGRSSRPGGPGKSGGPVGAMIPGEKAKNFKETIQTLLSYVKPFKFKIAIAFLFAIASTIFSIVSPMILGMATDIVVKGIAGAVTGGAHIAAGIDFTALLRIVVLLCILYGISATFSIGQSFIMAGVSQKITYILRREMSEKMDRLPLKYFDSKTHGEILSRVTNDIDTVNQTLSQSLTQIINSATTIIGILIMMLYISPLMTIVALVVLPVSLLLIRLVVKRSQQYFKNQQKYLGEINGHVEELYTGHSIVKAFNGEERSVAEFSEINEKLYESAWKSQFMSGFMMLLTNFVGNLAYVFVCVMGGFLALRGIVSIGNIQAFMQYVRSFNQPLSQVANVANVLQSAAAAAERVFEFLNEDEEVSDGSIKVTVNATEAEKTSGLTEVNWDTFGGKVSFDHVNFGYNPGKILIKDFNFTVNQGQRIAIVGPTGAGKTTIVKLLMRFYELNSGRILIDDVNIVDYSRKDLRDMFGMVLQDTWLFSGSIMENIRYGNIDASDEEVYAAAKSAHIHHFIKTQPNGYDMIINEDATNISQGQKQLMTIARAFLADAPILILDEATSSVDTRTESQIQRAMAALMQNRTSFIIAHRLSTIKDADMILVMNHGDIIEQGTHDDLLSAGGFYAELYNSQF